MIDRNHNLDGEHGVDLIAYMYGELDPASRTAFETHLTACDECAAELGSFADARLGVIEWRREDFDPLATPVILLPESEPVAAFADRPVVVGRLKAFWDAAILFPLAARVSTGAVAALLVGALIYFGAFSGGRSGYVANQASVPAVDSAPNVKGAEPTPEAARYQPVEEPKQLKPEKVIDEHSARRTELASTRTIVKPALAKSSRPRAETAVSRAPRLNNVEEEDDKSLRLSDLFAEIGSSEE